LSGGCIVSGASLSRSLLFTGVHIHSYTTVHETVVLPYARIGRNVRLSKAVIDSEVSIPDGLVVGEDPELDAKRFRRTESGVTLITQPMIDKLVQ
jgi:glucose-1-phosphate adenylyltransferase